MNTPTPILTSTHTLEIEDGTTMGGYLARPAHDQARGALVVAPELFGVSAHVRIVCDRLAVSGFMALAPDLYHRTAPAVELAEDEDGRRRGFELLEQMTREQALADVRASITFLQRRDRDRPVGMIGLSLGGHLAYLAAAELSLAATVVVYGGWLPTTEIPLGRPEPTLNRSEGITGAILVLVGDQDAVVPTTDREAITAALQAAGVRHEIVTYPGARHGFLSDRRDSHDPAAAADAWRRIDQLLTSELQ